MIPNYFVVEFPERCEQLLAVLEQRAKQQGLVSSLALLIASAAFTIPFRRTIENGHPLGRPKGDLISAVNRLRKCRFLDAPFWRGRKPEFFRYAELVNSPEYADGWRDVTNSHPMHSTETKDAKTVLITIRNALAHGNVVYLDSNGSETPGNRVCYIALLDKHDDRQSHRVVIFGEEDFLLFVKQWIEWLGLFRPKNKFFFPEAA